MSPDSELLSGAYAIIRTLSGHEKYQANTLLSLYIGTCELFEDGEDAKRRAPILERKMREFVTTGKIPINTT